MGAYSELDAALREDGDDFVDDDAFLEDDGPCTPPPAGTGNVLRAEPVSVSPAQSVEPQTAAPAQPTDDKSGNGTQEQAGEDTEKLTRRHMMECVMEHIQTLCLSDPAFAWKAMHPRKNMIRCSQYIGRKAWEYVQDEMKAKGIQPGQDNPSYASAIPEGVCYQWAVDYFNDPDAKEDHEEEEKFVPQPYRGASAIPAKKAVTKGKPKGAAKVKKSESVAPKVSEPAAQKKQDDGGQISFGSFAMPEEKRDDCIQRISSWAGLPGLSIQDGSQHYG